jgi:hypothetical protein
MALPPRRVGGGVVIERRRESFRGAGDNGER